MDYIIFWADINIYLGRLVKFNNSGSRINHSSFTVNHYIILW